MLTLLEVIKRSEQYLAKQGIERPKREAEEVIADALGLKRLDLYLQFDRPIPEEELQRLRGAIQRRGNHEPAGYIAGKVEFSGLSIQVNRSVLIPRPETEILVENIATTLSTCSLEGKVLWDVCCGSGYIGLAFKTRFPELQVVLSDLSAQALETARQNAHVDVTFKQGDLFAPFAGEKCDFLVCNPPYVTEAEYETLAPEVKNWEPRTALVSGPTGLEFYVRLAQELHHYTKAGAQIWLEIGTGQGVAVRALFEKAGWKCTITSDYAGHDRFASINN